MGCELPLGKIHVSLILDHNMGMEYAEELLDMGVFFLPKASFKMGIFSDPPLHTSGHFITGVPPPFPDINPSLQGRQPNEFEPLHNTRVAN